MRSYFIIFILITAIFIQCEEKEEDAVYYDVGELFGKCKSDGTCNSGLKCVNGYCKSLTDADPNRGGTIIGGGDEKDGGSSDTSSSSKDCSKGTCKGCCTPSGFCMEPGNLDTACGYNNITCVDCTASGKICSNGYCTSKSGDCSMTNCNGCCDLNQQCQSGFSNTACGNKGVLCTDCTATNQTCINGYCQ